MRGPDAMQEGLFTVAKLDDFVPEPISLCGARQLAHHVLTAMNPQFYAPWTPTVGATRSRQRS